MGGAGFRAESTFHVFFFTFDVKIMYKNWKITIKQWWGGKNSPFLGVAGGGLQVSWTKSIQMFLFLFFLLPLIHFRRNKFTL